MVTLKLKPNKPKGHSSDVDEPHARSSRPPLRGVGSGVRARPTLAQAQALREEREKQYQEQLRQRSGPRADAKSGSRAAAGRPKPARGEQRPSRDPSAAADRAANGRIRGEPVKTPATRGTQPPRPPASRSAQGRDERGASTGRGSNTAFAARADRQPAAASKLEPQTAPRLQSTIARDTLRLSKYMGELGIASRREADEWIAKGWVRVDGRVVSELGSRVVPGQQVTVDEKARFVQSQKVTVLVNKPVGYVSGQAEDGYQPAFVLVKPVNQWSEDRSGIRFLPQHLRSLVPAGRLDIDSVGLLVLTQDGRVAKQLIGENSAIEKEYLVRVAAGAAGGLSEQGLALLRHGLELDGQALREARVEWVNDDQLRFVLREGKKRQIRRMCEAVGLQVLGLKRVRIGKVMLGDLPPGQWRYLRVDEGFA